MKMEKLYKEPVVIGMIVNTILLSFYFTLLSYKAIPSYEITPLLIILTSVIAGRLIGARLNS